VTLPTLQELLTWPPGQAPYEKQEEAHQATVGMRLAALLMEQRTGKTIVTLGATVYHYGRFINAGGFGPKLAAELPKLRDFNRIRDLPAAPKSVYRPASWATRGIDALLTISMPGGVPFNWDDEAKLRLPEPVRAKTMVWRSSLSDNVYYAKELRELVEHHGLACLFVNGEALASVTARKAISLFLRTRRALVVADETSLLASQPGNVRARVLEAIKKLPGSIIRRVLDGTPSDENPLDLFAQLSFLDRNVLGFEKWSDFKRFYAEWEQKEVWIKDKKTGVPKQNFFPVQAVDELGRKKFQNLDVLADRLATVSFRVRRKDVFDIPDKLYRPYHFDLSPAQRAVYDPLRTEFEAELRTGKKVSAAHVLTRMIRLDQVASNYVPGEKLPMICANCQGDGCFACNDVGAVIFKTAKTIVDPKSNPRLDAFGDVLRMNPEPGIVWAVFDETVDAVLGFAKAMGRKVVRYDGKVDDEDKLVNLSRFKRGIADLIVTKESSLGRGLDGRAASWMCYVENGFSNRKRSQSEDRAEVAGRHAGTLIVDLLANDTFDEVKREAHAAKAEPAEYVMGKIGRKG